METADYSVVSHSIWTQLLLGPLPPRDDAGRILRPSGYSAYLNYRETWETIPRERRVEIATKIITKYLHDLDYLGLLNT